MTWHRTAPLRRVPARPSERREEKRGETRFGQRPTKEFVHRPRAIHRDRGSIALTVFWIAAARPRASPVERTAMIPCHALVLLPWVVHHRRRIPAAFGIVCRARPRRLFARRGMARRLRHSGSRGERRSAKPDALPDGVLPRPESVRHGLAHHYDRRRVLAIALVEASPADDRDLECRGNTAARLSPMGSPGRCHSARRTGLRLQMAGARHSSRGMVASKWG